jgi:hypothetical protein
MMRYSRAANMVTGPLLRKGLMCILLIGVVSAAGKASAEAQAQGSWKDPSRRAHLENDSLKASFQSGMLYRLEDRRTGKTLLSVDPAGLPGRQPIFGSTPFDLAACRVVQAVTKESIETVFRSPDGTSLRLLWSIEPDGGDLVLQASAQTIEPVEEFRILIPGCDITEHTLVWIHAYGVGHTANAPWNGVFLADPTSDGSPSGFPHPLVALFQGHDGGWFIEGREPRVGPANLMVKGTGGSAVLGMNRRFSFPSTEPTLFEVRIRTYQDQWEDAVDPYVDWLETGGGFVALDKLPRQQAWIANLKTQAYIGVGDYQGVEELAKRVNPEETFIGRQAEFRYYGFDIGYPDYRLTDGARKWTRRVRELGFHVGMHFNSKSVSAMFPDLVERFKPGFAVVGKDEQGNDVYEYIRDGQNRMYRVSAGLKDWRDYLIEQMADAVEAGVDVIYLDESMSPNGKWIVDGVDGMQGILLLMKEIQERYPHVAVQTEQFNTLTAKYGKMALSQMPLGHPLSGYIFNRFVKVVPEGVMYSPTDTDMMDAFDSWGYMLPGADTAREESWMRIAEAFHQYGLVPDSRLRRKQFREYTHHYSSGEFPVDGPTESDGGEKLFGFRGSNGVTAYLEKHPSKRGLVVYEPGKEPRWVGARHTGIRSYDGPGLPVYFGFRETIRDWIIYDDDKLLGLDPAQTYWFDPDLSRSAQRFHIYKVPEDYAGFIDSDKRAMSQEFARDDAYFLVHFAAHGEVSAYVPDEYDVYLDGRQLDVDRQTHTVSFRVMASRSKAESLNYHIELKEDTASQGVVDQGKPANLMAFKRSETELLGPWVDWPLYGSNDSLKWIKGNDANGFDMSVGTVGRFVGRIPKAPVVRIQGSYTMVEHGPDNTGEGVVRINGVEVLRVPHGGMPFKEQPFDVDISAYAGQYVLFEFTPDGTVRGGDAAWNNPRVVVGP